MKKLLAAGLLVSTLTVPATAGCHKFSIWNYPKPQRCPVQTAQAKMPDVKPEEQIFQQKLPRFTVSKYDTIILNLPPGTSDEEGRAAAIEVLKEVMGK